MNINEYFKILQDKVKTCYSVAEDAKQKGLDPLSKVEIPIATSLAEKVTGLISTVYPQIGEPKIAKRIIELEKEHGALSPAVALYIAGEISKGKFCKFKNSLEAIDAAIRVGIAYMTLGVVSSPIEGFTSFTLKKTREGEDYFCANYSGPIRSAGGTAAAFSLVIIDYLRELFGYAKYDPTEDEIKRTITELYDYHERVTNLQYLPTEEEIECIARNLPIQVAGDKSADKEVSNYKDLARIETDYIRSGFCLVIGEGLAQKAPKILRMVKKLREKGFKLGSWDFLEEYLKIHEKKEKGKTKDSPTYIKDLVAGRPVLGHPSKSGAFRMVYGRTRGSGYSALSIHPASMAVMGDFIAIGSQLKIELPTKGAAITVCDEIEGPIVKLKNGEVRKFRDFQEAKELRKDIEEIIYLGDMLIPYGDFANRNHVLMPEGYEEKQWKAEIKYKGEEIPKEINYENILKIAEKGFPLHPDYVFYWSQINYQDFLSFLDWVSNVKIIEQKILFPYNTGEQERFQKGKRTLELLGVEHKITTENVVLNEKDSKTLLLNLGINQGANISEQIEKVSKNIKKGDVLSIVNELCKYKIKDKAGTFIGARMGRPEKAKLRKLTGSPNVLFPVGQEGGRLRSVLEACEVGSIKADFPLYYCQNCEKETIYYVCEDCGNKASSLNYCSECNQKFFMEKCPKHNKGQPYMTKRIDINHFFKSAVQRLGYEKHEIPEMIKGVRGTSNESHVPENLAKGILRAKHRLNVNKDGTIRFDATELPITHFKPKEVQSRVESLKKLGYVRDIYGKPLENQEQILEIKPHDIILPSCPESMDERADKVFTRIARFIDDLLVRFYKSKPFYNVSEREDLLGHLVTCIAPHNCAGVVGRIIGFSKTQGLLASPYMHAAMRRDCLSYDSFVSVNKEGEWKVGKIGDFIEKENPQGKMDFWGTLGKRVSNFKTWSNPGEKQVLELTKHEPREMLKFYLEDGRIIETTENHKFYIKGKKEKKARELKQGDKLIVSYKRKIKGKDLNEIFLPEVFKQREDIMVRNVFQFLNKFEKVSKHNNFSFRDSFPIKYVEEFLKRHGKNLRDLPDEVRISAKRDNVLLPIRIKFDENLFSLIGLYIAEGYLRNNDSEKGFYQVSFAAQDFEVRKFIQRVMLDYFNLKSTEKRKDALTYSSKLLYLLFKDFFKLNSGAKNKRIPSLFLNFKKEKLAALLRGYFEGDGSVSLSDIRVTCDSVSEGLKYDLSFALSRFNIFSKFYDYKKKPGEKVGDFYKKKKKKIPEFKITKIIIPSNFVKDFCKIGFLTKKKNEILKEICKRNPKGMRIDFDKDYVYPKLKKIEKTGMKKSYCFNVEEEHNFFSNDILVHNCDGDEAAVILLLDNLINFSKQYLPSHRGGTQDAPLVLNAKIRAGEVDDMILDFDVVKEYPYELYKSGEEKKNPSEVKIEQVQDRLGKNEFKDINYTHDTNDINGGVLCSAYKKLATMQEKVGKQMELVGKTRAVETGDVAILVIERHFIRDIKGNLRKFSQQVFRCVKCNEKFRRPPLSGKCTKCGGRIIFTISEGGIIKYLEPAIDLATNFDVPEYVRQNLELTKKYIESIFGKEKEKQEALKKWF
jgi:DNA polymerase II large subunit